MGRGGDIRRGGDGSCGDGGGGDDISLSQHRLLISEFLKN